MQKFTQLATVLMLLAFTACGPIVDKQFANRQISSIDIQAGPKVDGMRAHLLKQSLQPALIAKLQGRGQPPALGMTVHIDSVTLPSDQWSLQYMLVRSGENVHVAHVSGRIDLWDSATRSVLQKDIGFARKVTFSKELTLGNVFYTNTPNPDTTDFTKFYNGLGQAAADEIVFYLYGAYK